MVQWTPLSPTCFHLSSRENVRINIFCFVFRDLVISDTGWGYIKIPSLLLIPFANGDEGDPELEEEFYFWLVSLFSLQVFARVLRLIHEDIYRSFSMKNSLRNKDQRENEFMFSKVDRKYRCGYTFQ